MELRRLERTRVTEHAASAMEEFYVEIDIPHTVKASVTDISLKGIGIEISGLDREGLDYLQREKDLFLKIHAGRVFFLAGVRNVWNTVTGQGEVFTYKCGMTISIISPQDNIELAAAIDALRNERVR